jgi:hypothetical protein
MVVLKVSWCGFVSLLRTELRGGRLAPGAFPCGAAQTKLAATCGVAMAAEMVDHCN